MEKIYATIVDIFEKRVYPACISTQNGLINDIEETRHAVTGFVLPGFVDAHIHIESSMLTPANFAMTAVRFGTVATISDPHEIANVLGLEGVDFMIKNGETVPMKFHFGAPSCVPATPFETSGASIDADQVHDLLKRKDVYFLSEMMNFPGVVGGDEDVAQKIKWAKVEGKPIDGHAPGLSGRDLEKYAGVGIQTDHECSTYEEAVEKINQGMIIQIREGSAARNFEKLYPLIDEYPDKVMLCSDDLHPDDLVKGHINRLLSAGIKKGLDVFNLVRAVSKNPVEHYGINVGMLRRNDPADFVIVKDLEDFDVISTYINGEEVYGKGRVNFTAGVQPTPNYFFVNPVRPTDFNVHAEKGKMKVIEALDGELMTKTKKIDPIIRNYLVLGDTVNDVLKIVVVNRYSREKPAIGFITNFGLKNGAMVSSIAHDSHNIIAVGTDDRLIAEVISWVQEHEGGVAFHDGDNITGLPLPVGGIMSDESAEATAGKYSRIQNLAIKAGSKLKAPYMSLSFMALLVIPELKIGNKGLFDVNRFTYTSLFDEEL